MRHILAILLFCGACLAQSPWPGQSGNAVGYAAYGSLNATSCGAFSSGSSWAARTTISNCTYSSYQTINCNYCEFDSVDFKGTGTTGGTLVSGSNVLFKGCRFQSNDLQNYNVQTTGANIYFVLSTVAPLASFYTSPPGSLWPTAGSGTNSTTLTSGTNAVAVNQGFEYGINIPSGGPVYVDGVDIWGYGNAIVFYSTTTQMTVVNSWMHDIAYPTGVTGGDYHTDGPGYLNGSTGPTNVTLQGNTIAMLGNTNSLAFQAATGGYTGLQFNSNYFSGNEKTVAPCLPGSTQCTGNFARNVIGTDVLPGAGILYSTAIGSNLVWTGNTIGFRSGTTWTDGDGWTPTSGMNGEFWLSTSLSTPNSTTDQGSNTHTGNLAPSSLLWLPSAANQKTITLTAGNTGNIGSISIGLKTGTNFSQTNNCGTAITNGTSCTITVTYAPTGTGPVNDVLQITDNDPSSPQIIPLLGIDAPTPVNCAAPTYGCALNSTQSGGKAVIQNISPTPNVGNLTGAGTVVSPADFGLPICRVTDSTFDPTIPNATIVANSGGSGDETLFNTNSTLYIVGTGGQGYPMSLNFNGVTCTTARLYASNASWTAHGGWYLSTDDPGWSYTNPYLLFIFDGTNPAIDSYNVTGYTPTGTPPSNVVQFDFRAGQTGSWGTTSANGLPSNYVMTWSSFGKQNKATGSLAADQIFGAGVSNAIVIAGVVASGTFTNGETVTQAGTGSTATLHFVHTNLYVDTVTGSPNNSGTWTGGTSGATFTPSASPTAAGQNYGTDAVAYKVGSGVSYLNTLTGVVTGDFGTVGTVGIGDRFTIHNTKLSKDGAWLLISFEFCLSTCTNNVNTPYFWQIGTTNLYPGCVPSNDCSGHYTEGYSHFINDDGSPTLQQISRVYGNNSTASVIPMGLPWSGSTCTGTNVVDVHQNWTNADTADSYPFFQTTIFATPATASNPYICAGADEVQGINPSTGTVYRFAHTYNTDRNTNFSTSSAIGAVSQDGNFALWSSDWEGTLGSTSGGSTCAITSTCRGDVFVVALTGVLSQATPSTCTPGSGTYSSTQTPACTNPNSGTTVQCYTTNGTTPATNGDGATCAIGTSLASGSTVSISTNTTLEIIAGTSTLADSAVTTYTYFIEAIAPTASPTSGSVPQTVTVTDTNTGTHIVCYNTTGSPATNGLGSACAPGSTHYTGPLSVTLPETLYIVAGTSTLVDSTVNSYTYGAVSNVAPAVVMF